VQWHDKTRKPDEVYLGYIERHFPEIRSLDDLVYYSQLNQAEAIKFGVEHYRRIKGRCWGTLIWQINDCWPVQSWSMIDYLGERKAVYYAAKRFYAPILVSLFREGDAVEAHVINDLSVGISGRLTMRLCSFDGTTVQESVEPVSVEAHAAARVASMAVERVPVDPREAFVHASLTANGRQADSENLLFLAEPKNLHLVGAQVQVTVDESEQRPAITLEAQQLAAYVWLAAPGLGPLIWSDNFFHLLPGRPYTVFVRDDVGAETLRERLTVRTLCPS
jgi:beta-mannosidase